MVIYASLIFRNVASHMDSQKKLVEKWLLHATRKAHAHAICAQRAHFYHNAIGIPSVALSAIVGAAVFAELQSSGFINQIVVLIMVLAAGVLTSLQTFLNFGEKEQLHRSANQKYSFARRRLDKVIYQSDAIESHQTDEIERLLNEAQEVSPPIPNRTWNLVEKKIPDASSL